MFRSLGGKIEKRIKNLTKDSDINHNLDKAFGRFLEEYFPEAKNLIFHVSILDGNIVIQTPNKTTANELILKMEDLSRVLKEEQIPSKQVIVR